MDNQDINEVNETGSAVLNSNPKTFTDLNMTINGNMDNDVYLDGDYVYNPNSDSSFASGVEVNRAVTIHGKGYTIDGVNAARIFTVSNSSAVFKDIIFVNANAAGNGGAINGECTAINCTFVNNSAGSNGGAMYGKGCSAVNCTFINNYATS